MTCIMMGKYYIRTGVNVKNGIFQLPSASRRAAFETSIRQMVAPFCIFCKCAGKIYIVTIRKRKIRYFILNISMTLLVCRSIALNKC